MGWGERIAPTTDLSDFERSVIVEALTDFIAQGEHAPSFQSASSELRHRRLATARDLSLRLA